VVREAGKRVLGMRHFDVQLVGGMVLNSGKIAEMRTGEGKTLVATLAAYLNALPGKGVHVVTVNDYLARRDAAWMGQIYHFLGLSVGVINSPAAWGRMRPPISTIRTTSPTDGEQGFRHLRPAPGARPITPTSPTAPTTSSASTTCATTWRSRRAAGAARSLLRHRRRGGLDPDRRGAHAADHLGPVRGHTDLYEDRPDHPAPDPAGADQTNEEGQPDFGPGDFSVDEKASRSTSARMGHQKVEDMLTEIGLLGEGESLYDAANIVLMHHVYAALRAHALFQKNVDYIVRDGQIIIVDEFTGRTMPGRRWSEGCTRRWRPRKACRSSRKTRPWRRSPSRICSGCIRSWPA
jgi:preprotein translocase subunit SecA